MKQLNKYILNILILCLTFRIIFYLLYNPNPFNLNNLITSIIQGIRYDISALSYLMLPIWFLLFFQTIPSNKKINTIIQSIIRNYLIFLIIIFIISSIIDIGFYYEFQTRINYLAIEYILFIEDTLITIIKNFPYNFLLLSSIFIITIFLLILKKQIKLIKFKRFQSFNKWGIYIILSFLCIGIGMRGGLQKKPLNWSNANITNNRFTNILSLNPIWNLGMTIQTAFKEDFSNKLNSINMDLKHSQQIARNSTQELNNYFLNNNYPVLRKTTSTNLINNYNVVIILMESFAGSYIGKLGNKDNITPNFDKLTNEGVLFTRMFSTGTRTNRGLAGTLLSFPGLPRFKSILNDASVDQNFSSIANILKQKNYETFFLVGGKLNYDNRYGFFLGQGFDNFYGAKDYNNVFKTTWGIADEHLFEKSFNILKNTKKPILMSILTLSNHPTYEFPKPNNFIPVSNKIKHQKRFNAFKYSDWALGQFMEKCKKEPFYENTIFVILGDHGITSTKSHQNSSMELSAYYIPCLIIAPNLNKNINHRVASQIDIIPTILHLLGDEFIHNSWGKNLFNKKQNMDFAIIAPSGLNHLTGIITDEFYYIHNLNEDNSNELYSISNINYPLIINQISQNDTIEEKLRRKLLGVTKSAYNALISYQCGILNEK